jgi:aspartate/glutamate racemase
VHGTEWSATRGLFIKIARDLKLRTDIDGLILGGCELSLVFPAGAAPDAPIPFLDMVDVHAAAAIAETLK